MNSLQVQSIGAFVIAGAHYVRNGDDNWYVAWVIMAVALCAAGAFISKKA